MASDEVNGDYLTSKYVYWKFNNMSVTRKKLEIIINKFYEWVKLIFQEYIHFLVKQVKAPFEYPCFVANHFSTKGLPLLAGVFFTELTIVSSVLAEIGSS